MNTGGKALDVFELLTATYAAQGHELRADGLGTAGTMGLQSRVLVAFDSAAGRSAPLSDAVREALSAFDSAARGG